jgi:dienelactone hydrolase
MKGVGYDAFAAERAWEAMQMLFRHVLVRPNATTQPRAE